MTKKVIIGIVIAALILGVVLYFVYKPKPKPQTEEKKAITDTKNKILTPAELENEKGQIKDIRGALVSPINGTNAVKGQ